MASRADSTRLENDEDERWGRAPGPPAGIPLGAILLLASLALVFVYGIYLKSAGAPAIVAAGSGTTSRAARPPVPASPGARPSPGRRTPGHDAGFPAPGGATDKPLLPDRPGPAPAVPSSGLPAGASDSDPSLSSQASPASPRSGEPAGASRKTEPGAGGAASPPEPDAGIPRSRTVTGAPEPGAVTPAEAKAPPQPPAGSRAVSQPTAPARPAEGAPRGSAPAQADRRARELLRSGKYAEAARSWGEWARSVPSGSWTVQVAALHLDRPETGRSLTAAQGRSGLFVLPPGSNGLSPVCVGVYASIEDARKAAGATAPLPGSTGKPFPKSLDSLAKNR